MTSPTTRICVFGNRSMRLVSRRASVRDIGFPFSEPDINQGSNDGPDADRAFHEHGDLPGVIGQPDRDLSLVLEYSFVPGIGPDPDGVEFAELRLEPLPAQRLHLDGPGLSVVIDIDNDRLAL